MKTWIFNPFTYVAGGKSLFAGLIFMTVTLITAFYSGTHFDGAIDAHVGRYTPFWVYILEQLIAWGCIVIVFFLVALVLSRSQFRFIDIAGTIALARAPMLLVAVMGFIPALHQVNVSSLNNTVLVIGLLMLIPVIWMIALMYNAFAVSFNLKGTKAVTGFITGLILAEAASVVLNQVLHHTIR